MIVAEMEIEPEFPNSNKRRLPKDFHCGECQSVFRYRNSLRVHKKMKNESKYHKLPCSDQTHEHLIIKEVFESFESAFDWFRTRELDKMFRVKRSKPDNYYTYFCRHRTCQKDESRLPKIRQVRSLPFYPCNAQLTMFKAVMCQCPESERDGIECLNRATRIRVYGCLTHCHEIEIINQRISTITKNYVVALLREGIPKRKIMERYCREKVADNPDQQLITMNHLRNWEKFHIKRPKKTILQSPSEPSNPISQPSLELSPKIIPQPILESSPKIISQPILESSPKIISQPFSEPRNPIPQPPSEWRPKLADNLIVRQKKALDIVSNWQARLTSTELCDGIEALIQHVEAFKEPTDTASQNAEAEPQS